MAFNPAEKHNLLYLYDLPYEATARGITELFEKTCEISIDQMPQLRKDITKPFATAIVKVKTPEEMEKVLQKMRYFNWETMDGSTKKAYECRTLPYDPDFLGANRQKLVNQQIFIPKLSKSVSQKQLDMFLTEKFGEIKSLKISMNDDHQSKGYGFACFANPEAAEKALNEKLGKITINMDDDTIILLPDELQPIVKY
jgi:polyadenylate-binding protein